MKRLLGFVSFICFVLLAFVACSMPVFATLGVGIGTGKIVVEDKLRSGMIYKLPDLSVFNTGDETGTYRVGISYHEKQEQLRPEEDWFRFDPAEFELKPGEAKQVEVRISLPVKTVPGDYFAYLEGYPIKKAESGGTSIGIAAATKLYFTISPSNVFQFLYYRTISLWKEFYPWSGILAFALCFFIIVKLFKKFFKVELSLKLKKKDAHKEESKVST